ncbi:MAG: adenylyl-sulfate kinase [Bacteroidetes bacterium SW_10_40_5]|nr:MAG: adenylyl-sulfate kinase [Bacteroidetes bacterium SW_10_40_5]
MFALKLKGLEHIHPIFDQILNRKEKEGLLKQKGIVVWMTGLSGSGKSTIAKGLESQLHQSGYVTKLLDGDNVRSGLCKNLGFSQEDRIENIRRIAEVSRLFLDTGVITVNSFISPTLANREMAGDIIGHKDFIKEFTGIHAKFEAPVEPSLEINTDQESAEESVNRLFNHLVRLVSIT